MDDITIKISSATTLLRELGDGKHIRIDGEPYPIAMGEDFSVGYLYNDDRVVGDFTVRQLIELASKVVIIPDGKK